MTYAQPSSLNRYVAEPLPVTWAVRWNCIRLLLPLIVFIAICAAESAAWAQWKQDRLSPATFSPIFLVPIALLGGLLITHEIELRKAWRSGRRLNLLEKGISFQAAARPIIRWRKVVAFWFENISGETQFCKLTVEYIRDRKVRPRRYSLVLDRHTQCPVLISELKLIQQQHDLSYRLELDRSPLPRPASKNPALGMSLYLAGALLFLHGMPLLMVPLLHESDHAYHSDASVRWSPKQREKFHAFLDAHFSSKAELRHFMLMAGGALMATGAGLMVWGERIQRPKKDGGLSGQAGNGL